MSKDYHRVSDAVQLSAQDFIMRLILTSVGVVAFLLTLITFLLQSSFQADPHLDVKDVIIIGAAGYGVVLKFYFNSKLSRKS